VFYYYVYFREYRLLKDDFSSHKQYYLSAYTAWGVISFNVLFTMVFAQFGALLAQLFPNAGFGAVSFYSMLLLLVQTILDGATLGLVESYSIKLTNLSMHSIFAKTYVYVANLLVNLAFISSVVSVLGGILIARREVRNVVESKEDDLSALVELSPSKAREFIRNIKNGNISIERDGKKIIRVLSNSRTKQTRDTLLQLMQRTKDAQVFESCIDYFFHIRDYRFRRVCSKITDPMKRKIIEKRNSQVRHKV